MRLGQTSIIHFGSQVLSSVVGFVATLYIARELGSATLGTYSVFLAVLIWLKVATGGGIQGAVRKRISESNGGERDLGAGIVVQVVAFVLVAAVALLFAAPLNEYLRFDGAHLLVAALGLTLCFSFVRAVLEGQQQVHIAALLRPVDRTVRSVVQIAAILLLSGGLLWLVGGYAIGALVATLVGLFFVALRPRWPQREQFERILGFARYFWLSSIEGRSFSSMDTVVLGVFVSSSLIGVYEVAWNLASIFAIFGTSITSALFPTISNLSSENSLEVVSDLVNDALAYAGLFIVPGLVGSLIIGDRVLSIYGEEFTGGATVLVLLVVAQLVYAYESQFVSTLNAIDRPGVAFRVSFAFVGVNLVLNLVLVWRHGWHGAAVATMIAACVGLLLGYRALSRLVSFTIPVSELARQWFAAGVMGIAVYLTEEFVSASAEIPGVYVTVLLALFGAGVYFGALAVVSERFRTTARSNIPEI